MRRFITIILAIFEFVFYTFFMVLIDDNEIQSRFLKLALRIGVMLILAFILYLFIRLVLKKLNYPDKKNIYFVCLWNLGIGLFFPLILMIAIPNDTFLYLSLILLVSTFYYGILINLFICLFNKKKKKQ